MKILIAGLKENIQAKRFREEGEKRGHAVDGCLATELTIYTSSNTFEPTLRGKDMEEYDLIYLMLSKRRWEWYTAAFYLKEKKGTIIVNKKSVEPTYNYYLTPAVDYLKQYKANLPFPKSGVIYSHKSIDTILQKFDFPLILKTAGGRQGRGVYKLESKDELVEKIKSLKGESLFFVIREFIPNDGDIRVFTVGYKAIGAMKRTPPEGDFRSNISVGGEGEVFDLEKYPNVRELAEKAAKVTETEIAGVDIMINKKTDEPYILEVNPGPQFTGFEKYTNVNAAEEIIKYFESLHAKEGSEPSVE